MIVPVSIEQSFIVLIEQKKKRDLIDERKKFHE
jgi:hypothetical protein